MENSCAEGRCCAILVYELSGCTFVSYFTVVFIKIQFLSISYHLPILTSSPPPITAFNKKYTKEHEWVLLSPDNKTGTIGISDYAAHALGEVVYVELPTVPLEVGAGDAIGAVESVKSASDINSPITCKIVQANTMLEETPSTINKDPEDESSAGGWVAKVEIGEQGIKDLEELMDESAYKAFTEDS